VGVVLLLRLRVVLPEWLLAAVLAALRLLAAVLAALRAVVVVAARSL
jgi:hypothetical protein